MFWGVRVVIYVSEWLRRHATELLGFSTEWLL